MNSLWGGRSGVRHRRGNSCRGCHQLERRAYSGSYTLLWGYEVLATLNLRHSYYLYFLISVFLSVFKLIFFKLLSMVRNRLYIVACAHTHINPRTYTHIHTHIDSQKYNLQEQFLTLLLMMHFYIFYSVLLYSGFEKMHN